MDSLGLSTSTKNDLLKYLKSTLQIVATCTETYAVPEYALFKPKEVLKYLPK